MRGLAAVGLAVLTLAASALLFDLMLARLAASAVAFSDDPAVREMLVASMADQRELAALDPGSEGGRRQRHQDTAAVLQRLDVLSHSRSALLQRYRVLMLVVFVVAASLAVGVWAWRQARLAPRLDRLRGALESLAAGRSVVEPVTPGRDLVGRIGTMIQETSQVLGHQRARLAALENLSVWQESARRHAHEMRTPLTSLQLELDRLESLAGSLQVSSSEDGQLSRAIEGAQGELRRLADFTRRFTSFAKLPRPRLEKHDLGALLEEIAELYASAWPCLDIELDLEPGVLVAVDRDMVRQVLVNLWENTADALGGRPGHSRVRLRRHAASATLDISDDGPGLARSIVGRLFEPYTTTKEIGEGMGLGLAISRKILLDHGGDLELDGTAGGVGATFRLTLPIVSEVEQ